jgi:hypothetical protein
MALPHHRPRSTVSSGKVATIAKKYNSTLPFFVFAIALFTKHLFKIYTATAFFAAVFKPFCRLRRLLQTINPLATEWMKRMYPRSPKKLAKLHQRKDRRYTKKEG